MKSEKLFRAIGQISDEKIAEADAVILTTKSINSAWLKWALPSVAACLIIVVAIFALPELSINPENPFKINGLIEGQHSSRIVFGDGEYGELNFVSVDVLSASGAPPYIDPAKSYEEQWSVERVIEYLGTDFRPQYVPDDLHEYRDDGVEPFWTVVFNNDGTAVPFFFSFGATYSESFDEAYDPLRRSLHIQAAKGSLPLRCALYTTETDTPSNIRGNEVSVGYCKTDYGPYTGEEKTPAGYVDVYIAEFMYNDVGYYIESHNLTQEEFANVLWSIIK